MSRFVSVVTVTVLPSNAHHCVPEEGSAQMSGGWMTHPNNSVLCTEGAQRTFIFRRVMPSLFVTVAQPLLCPTEVDAESQLGHSIGHMGRVGAVPS